MTPSDQPTQCFDYKLGQQYAIAMDTGDHFRSEDRHLVVTRWLGQKDRIDRVVERLSIADRLVGPCILVVVQPWLDQYYPIAGSNWDYSSEVGVSRINRARDSVRAVLDMVRGTGDHVCEVAFSTDIPSRVPRAVDIGAAGWHVLLRDLPTDGSLFVINYDRLEILTFTPDQIQIT